MLSIRIAREVVIDKVLWNTLKDALFTQLKVFHSKGWSYDPNDANAVVIGDLADIWYSNVDDLTKRKAFLKVLNKRYQAQGGRYVGQEDKPTPTPLRSIVNNDGDNRPGTVIEKSLGVEHPIKQLDLFKDK